jgi:hypothetical protein
MSSRIFSLPGMTGKPGLLHGGARLGLVAHEADDEAGGLMKMKPKIVDFGESRFAEAVAG